jgi:hypothetical protein
MSLIKCSVIFTLVKEKERKEKGNSQLVNRKNVVLNYTEMEAKVHDATSADPWGASSTLMLEIAQGTYN